MTHTLDDLLPHAGHALREAFIPELPGYYRGKVRENYDLPDGRRIIIATDRLSAFDRVLTAVPLKGQVLTQLARYWFERTADICPNHVIAYPDPNVLVCKRLNIMPVEIVVRDYLAGTTSTAILTMYKAGRREMYGHRFPDGMLANQKLPQTIITPTTKAFGAGHDEERSAEQILAERSLTKA
ncbi:MAG: purC, partial [Rhodospirillales bacterium]|nr:purC [Rhodospirillales bacterium]